LRLPAPLLTSHLGQLLEGMLLWAADSKNKFRLKVKRHARVCAS
jgi:ribosomal RNA-processing protein 12